MDEKRAKGLCFWCDEKFIPGHNCWGRKQFYFLEVGEEEEEWEVSDGLSKEGAIDESTLSPQMSVHALDGTIDYRSMRVKGGIKRKMVHVLIDSGSTHNFMDLETSKKLSCKLERIPPLSVAVANSNRVHNSFMSTTVA